MKQIIRNIVGRVIWILLFVVVCWTCYNVVTIYRHPMSTVTFDTNGGEKIEPQTLKYLDTLPQASREGYTFGGWYSDVKLSKVQSVVPHKNIKLYAYWEEESRPSDFVYYGSDSITIVEYKSSDSVVCIPEYIGGIRVTNIETSAFENCNRLTSVTIPDSVTSIGPSAFKGCANLTDIVIPDSVTNIETYAFENCDSLTSVTIPDSVTSIGSFAFKGCANLMDIVIPDSVTNIDNFAFENCDSLTSVTIPDSVTSIGGFAFYDCDILTSVIIGCGVIRIGVSAFKNCYSLENITLGNNVTSIGFNAFENCINMTDIMIPDSVTEIASYAFYSCNSLMYIEFSGTKSQWNAISKEKNWNYSTGEYTVYCIDGKISKLLS